MPELPEVETICRDLADILQGEIFEEVTVVDDRVLGDISKRKFEKICTQAKVNLVERRGKAIFWQLNTNDYFLIQLRMTGQFHYLSSEDFIEKKGRKSAEAKHESNLAKVDYYQKLKSNEEVKIIFKIDDQRWLAYKDIRTLGKFYYSSTEDFKYLSRIGIDPLTTDFSFQRFKTIVSKSTMPIKPLLMDQYKIAGVGNIYASEVLFLTGIHPERKGTDLTDNELKKIHGELPVLLQKSIDMRGTSMRDYRDIKGQKGKYNDAMQIYGKTGQECLKCKAQVQRIVQAGRSTFFCETCQH